MYVYMEKQLRKFLNDEKSTNLENAGSKVCYLPVENTKVAPKPIVNIVFSRYQGAEVTETKLDKYGYVLAIPSYWIDVAANTAVLYISSFVDAWLKEYFGYDDGSDDDSGGKEDEHHCDPHHHHCHPVPPGPPHPPGPPFTPPPPQAIDARDPSQILKHGYPVKPGD